MDAQQYGASLHNLLGMQSASVDNASMHASWPQLNSQQRVAFLYLLQSTDLPQLGLQCEHTSHVQQAHSTDRFKLKSFC